MTTYISRNSKVKKSFIVPHQYVGNTKQELIERIQYLEKYGEYMREILLANKITW